MTQAAVPMTMGVSASPFVSDEVIDPLRAMRLRYPGGAPEVTRDPLGCRHESARASNRHPRRTRCRRGGCRDLRAGPLKRFLTLAALLIGSAAAVMSAAPAAVASDASLVCRFSDKRFTEISGLASSIRHPGVLYLHNDSGDGPFIYAVDAKTCATLATLTIRGASMRDAEAIATGRDEQGRAVIWFADIGDNLDSWPFVKIYEIREPKRLANTTVDATAFRFTYGDIPHNAEALLANPAKPQLWVVTKQLAHGSLYRLPEPLRSGVVNIASKIRREGGLVTDGAVSPDGLRYVLRDYDDAYVYAGLPPGRKIATIPLPFQLQGEAITWAPDGRSLLIASERDKRLLRVTLPMSAMAVR